MINNNIPKDYLESTNESYSLYEFITEAFKFADIAEAFECQNPINKYEANPTPSQPINIWIKLSDITSNSIAKVKKEM